MTTTHFLKEGPRHLRNRWFHELGNVLDVHLSLRCQSLPTIARSPPYDTLAQELDFRAPLVGGVKNVDVPGCYRTMELLDGEMLLPSQPIASNIRLIGQQ
jgi:hypothetical protein